MNSSLTHTPQIPVSCGGNASKSENHPPVLNKMPEGEVRVDDAKIMPPRRGEMKVRVWECGERGWVKGGRCQYYVSREGGRDEGESVGVWGERMGEGWMMPR